MWPTLVLSTVARHRYTTLFHSDRPPPISSHSMRERRWPYRNETIVSPSTARSRRPFCMMSQIAKFMGPTWDPPGSCRPQMGPMLAQWTLLSGVVWKNTHNTCNNPRGEPLSNIAYGIYIVMIQNKHQLSVIFIVSTLGGIRPCYKGLPYTHSWCSSSTSSTRSFGTSYSSGSAPLACSNHGRISNCPPGPFQPNLIHNYKQREASLWENAVGNVAMASLRGLQGWGPILK